MKRFVWLLFATLLLAVMVLFVLKRPDGQTWLSIDNITYTIIDTIGQNDVISDAENALNTAFENVSNRLDKNTNSGTKTIIYRWQDAQGAWHFSDKPNTQGVSETVELNSQDITVIPAISLDKEQTVPTLSIQKHLPESPINRLLEAKNVLDDAKQVQGLVDKRQAELDRAIESATSQK